MKEVTIVTRAQITDVATVSDEEADRISNLDEHKKLLTDALKETLSSDDVVIEDFQVFVRDKEDTND